MEKEKPNLVENGYKTYLTTNSSGKIRINGSWDVLSSFIEQYTYDDSTILLAWSKYDLQPMLMDEYWEYLFKVKEYRYTINQILSIVTRYEFTIEDNEWYDKLQSIAMQN